MKESPHFSDGETVNVRLAQSMMDELKALDNYPEFVRQAIQKALDEHNKQK